MYLVMTNKSFHFFSAVLFWLSGNQFQTFNVHQLLHLPEVVHDVGPLWSNSCYPFGDLRDLFHGTKNVDGQVCSFEYF